MSGVSEPSRPPALADPATAWRVLLAGVLVSLGASLLAVRQDADAATAAAVATSWLAGWVVLARFRLFSYRRHRRWIIYLGLVWAFAVAVPAGSVVSVLLTLPFMLRQQRSLRLLPSRRRALAFLLAFVAFVATFSTGFGLPEGPAGDVVLVGRTGVQAFWVSAILTLLFNMRLHFLRLRTKLAVAGLLIGPVPLLLLSAFALLLLYAALGGARGKGVETELEAWRRGFAGGAAPTFVEDPPLRWSQPEGAEDVWPARLVRAWRVERRHAARQEGDFADESLLAPFDTTTYVRLDDQLWLARVNDPGGDAAATVEAVRIDQRAFADLARRLRADVVLGTGPTASDAHEPASLHIEGRFRDPPEGDLAARWWRKPWPFGASLVEVPRLVGSRLQAGDDLFIGLRTSVFDLARDLVGDHNQVNVGITVALVFVAILLAFAGLVAFIFSARITGGITGAVRALHGGTRRIAAGDLETSIAIDNEDEFGDLADSFNEMTAAVKQGREDALARDRLQQEMAMARQIQQRLLPHDEPLLAGWDVTGVSIPSQQVGGDYFDFLVPGPGRLGVAIADVSGKGVPAALLMSNLQASLKAQVLHPAPVAATVARINDLLADSTDSNMFATFLYGELDPASGRFTCTNAGHDPGLVVRADGRVEWLTSGGLILGMLPDQDYTQAEVDLAAGDVLVLYTDGITEAGAPTTLEIAELAEDEEVEDRQFGEERLAEVVVPVRGESALAIREAVLQAVRAHLGERPQGDDITLIVVKRNAHA